MDGRGYERGKRGERICRTQHERRVPYKCPLGKTYCVDVEWRDRKGSAVEEETTLLEASR
jgi:hypothetical protein